MYASDQTLHDALNGLGAPVQQGATAADSAAALKEYIYRVILSTPVSVAENGVDKGAGVHFTEIFQRLMQDDLFKVLRKLERVFILDSTPVATWSRQVLAAPQPSTWHSSQGYRGGGEGTGICGALCCGSWNFPQPMIAAAELCHMKESLKCVLISVCVYH